VRLAEKSQAQAARLLLSSIVARETERTDWPDELASALIANPSLSLSRWSKDEGLKPWQVSRGFMQVFGLSPSAFRVRTRARQAWKSIETNEEPLAAIATTFGFAVQPHMTRSVKHLTGMGPQAWRKLQIDSRHNHYPAGRTYDMPRSVSFVLSILALLYGGLFVNQAALLI
jgi:AraC-like DNA-binding protein